MEKSITIVIELHCSRPENNLLNLLYVKTLFKSVKHNKILHETFLYFFRLIFIAFEANKSFSLSCLLL